METRRILSILATTLVIGGGAAAQPPEDVRAALDEPNSFETSRQVSAIPDAVRVAFSKVCNDEPFEMAEPGAAYQEFCTSPDNVPRRRLHAVSLSSNLCILFYEIGGRGHSDHVVVFNIAGNEPTLEWHGVTDHAISTPSALRRAINRDTVRDELNYGF